MPPSGGGKDSEAAGRNSPTPVRKLAAMQKSWLVLREQSPAGSYARRRAAAIAGAGLFFAGLLDALGLGHLVLLAYVVVLALACAAVAAGEVRRRRAWPRPQAPEGVVTGRFPGVRKEAGLSARLRTEKVAASARRVAHLLAEVARGFRGRLAAWLTRSRPLAQELRPRLERVATSAGTAAGTARGWLSAQVEASQGKGRELRPAVERLAAHARSPRLAAAEPMRVDRQRQALQLNAEGARLRREGAYDAAVAQHEAALEIFRELGDRRAEALTLNNVALAKGRAGDEAAAVATFEESLAMLRDLADPQHEAQVTANLGITLRRNGHDDRAKELLASALEKLEPDSAAARRVEVELRRAS